MVMRAGESTSVYELPVPQSATAAINSASLRTPMESVVGLNVVVGSGLGAKGVTHVAPTPYSIIRSLLAASLVFQKSPVTLIGLQQRLHFFLWFSEA